MKLPNISEAFVLGVIAQSKGEPDCGCEPKDWRMGFAYAVGIEDRIAGLPERIGCGCAICNSYAGGYCTGAIANGAQSPHAPCEGASAAPATSVH